MPIVIRIGPDVPKPKPNVSRIQEVSFEDAFGEHSEAHGKLLKKLKAAKPFKKIAAKVKSTAAHMKAKAAARRAARNADSGGDAPADDAPADDSASQDATPADDSTATDSADSSTASEDTQSAEGSIQKHNHKITHMENATIIRLAPNQQLQRVTSFEEAFGEHSNLFGSMRAKWLKKRAANQKIIQEAKREINDEKTETKVNRIRNRAKKRVARVEKRGSIQQARIAKRRAAQQARIAKRTDAKRARQAKRALGKDDDSTPTDDTSQDAAATDDSGSTDDSGAADNSGSTDDTSQGLADDSGSADDSGAAQDGETSNDGDVDYGGGDSTGTDDGGGTDSSSDGFSDTFDGSNGDYDSFDGKEAKLAPDDFYDYKEGNDTLKARIHPKVKEAALKSEWNKECVCKLQSQFDALESDFDGSDASEAKSEFLAGQIDKRRQRAVKFDRQLNNYAKAPGAMRPRRMAEVGAARREAIKQRIGVRRSSQNAQAAIGNPVTAIEQGLNPEFSDNKITVPASSADGSEAQDYFCGADGYKTGITALDSKNDFDAPNPIDINLGFDASKMEAGASSLIKSVNWKAVGITAVVTIALVVVVSKLSK